MKLLAIAGSVREESYNRALILAMQKHGPEGSTMTVYDRIQEIPVFHPDTANGDLPETVRELSSMIREADGVIISTPEYAHGIPGVLKNMLDWFVSSDALVFKPVVATSVSTSGLGGVRAHSPLVLILFAMNARVVVEGSINVPDAHRKFDDRLNLTDEVTLKALEVMFMAMQTAVNTYGTV